MGFLHDYEPSCGYSFEALAATDFRESGSHLSEPSLPGVSEVLHLGDEAVVLHVEAELAQLVAPQTELLRHGARRHGLEPRRDLRHVVSLPVLRVHDHALALIIRRESVTHWLKKSELASCSGH